MRGYLLVKRRLGTSLSIGLNDGWRWRTQNDAVKSCSHQEVQLREVGAVAAAPGDANDRGATFSFCKCVQVGRVLSLLNGHKSIAKHLGSIETQVILCSNHHGSSDECRARQALYGVGFGLVINWRVERCEDYTPPFEETAHGHEVRTSRFHVV